MNCVSALATIEKSCGGKLRLIHNVADNVSPSDNHSVRMIRTFLSTNTIGANWREIISILEAWLFRTTFAATDPGIYHFLSSSSCVATDFNECCNKSNEFYLFSIPVSVCTRKLSSSPGKKSRTWKTEIMRIKFTYSNILGITFFSTTRGVTDFLL